MLYDETKKTIFNVPQKLMGCQLCGVPHNRNRKIDKNLFKIFTDTLSVPLFVQPIFA